MFIQLHVNVIRSHAFAVHRTVAHMVGSSSVEVINLCTSKLFDEHIAVLLLS